MSTQYLRQVIVARKDLNMPAGKLAAMVAHAAMTFLLVKLKDRAADQYSPANWTIEGFSPEEFQWMTELDPGLEKIDQRSMGKIVCFVDNLEKLLDVIERAKIAGLQVHTVTDSGHSHNKFGDLACAAIGPDWPAKLEPVTGHLKTR